ncbi:lipase 2 [Podospora conica]|nr:lipase 2 [Schizothecium conicum]
MPRSGIANAATDVASPIVDLGYSQYQGFYNSTVNWNVYRGIRFAAPPKRFGLPEAPTVSREKVFSAISEPPRCPQTPSGPLPTGPVNFEASLKGSEDCLFLNVFSPANATKLPVAVWIHGGGYGVGQANSFDYGHISKTVNNGFVIVQIQYRVGAFGFLSSAEVAKHGTLNPGVHDMLFALEWVQKYISLFGGDPDEVTISGESAGGGAVMLMAMANGGSVGTRLFKRGIASSPYYPTQPKFDDPQPEEFYRDFARRSNCLAADATVVPADGSVFKCLQNADSLVLQNASAWTSYNGKYGQWAFIPVTDGTLLQEQPEVQLLKGKVNGESILSAANANEATYFVRQNISTSADFVAFLHDIYPHLSKTPRPLYNRLLELYAVPASFPANLTAAQRFDTDGLNPPFATTMSAYASGWQQAANNLYAETTFVCSAYWLADAYAVGGYGKKAWRYQYSIPNAFHGSDLTALQRDPVGIASLRYDADFQRGFQNMWGRYVVDGVPTLGKVEAAAAGLAAAREESWQPWGAGGKFGLLNVNVTAAQPVKADWSVVDAMTFEGGRGERCKLWAEIGFR